MNDLTHFKQKGCSSVDSYLQYVVLAKQRATDAWNGLITGANVELAIKGKWVWSTVMFLLADHIIDKIFKAFRPNR